MMKLVIALTVLCLWHSKADVLRAYGYDWNVRDTGGRIEGPGPNTFSASNVQVGRDGSLVLRLLKSHGQWSCSEVMLSNQLGYGDYDFTLNQDVSSLADSDPNVVLGFFLYKDDTHELDIEFARWGEASSSASNADYVNQPGGPGKTLLWKQPSLTNTTHRISFRPGRVDWHSFRVGIEDAPFQSFSSILDVPAAENMLVHMNLWLFGGKTSWSGSSLDVAVSDFRFTPHNGSVPPVPPPPQVPVYLPDGCANAMECYVFASRAEAEAACQAAGHQRLCHKNESIGHSLCKAGWFTDGQGYWMEQSHAGCGHAGFNPHSGNAGAYCCSDVGTTVPATTSTFLQPTTSTTMVSEPRTTTLYDTTGAPMDTTTVAISTVTTTVPTTTSAFLQSTTSATTVSDARTTTATTTTVIITTGGHICTGKPCASQSHCRSKWGFCGVTIHHCNDESLWCGTDATGCQCGDELTTTAQSGQETTTTATIPIGGDACPAKPCASSLHCRSKWGYCGVTTAHCNSESLWCGSDAVGCQCVGNDGRRLRGLVAE